MTRFGPVLVDANVIIEAVRTHSWAAITGQLSVESVNVCCDETQQGSNQDDPAYVSVTKADLSRLGRVHAVDDTLRAAFKLAYAGADAMDRGEQDLLAHAYSRAEEAWALCLT